MKFLKRLAHWWLNWMSGDALAELELLRRKHELLRIELMHSESFSRYVHKKYGEVFEQNRRSLLLIAKLRDTIQRFEAKAGCSLKYLEELEDLRFKVRSYEQILQTKMHAQIKIPNPPTGADIGLV